MKNIKNYHTALTELIDYLDYGNTGAYFAQPTQGMQNAMGEAFAQYALSSEKLYRDIVTDNADDYRFAQWQLAVIALVVVLILLVAWYGIRPYVAYAAGKNYCSHSRNRRW
ncbi:methyl-accepting chemotaxis protein II [Escherichia coli]|uniref:Methyl-accepting chemotaxis protein II n=1 Tax=Escherichia coli TaxID=562 RepID=A0A447XEA3_ECOLX|nr:methyl-accepting chemotaxis protein II [Escherichia coli]